MKWWAPLLVALVPLSGAPATPQHGLGPPHPVPHFVDATTAVGIDFRHHHGGTGDKQLPEAMGAGVAWIDYDRDGRWDLYFVDSGPLPASMLAERPPTWRGDGEHPVGANVLYRGAATGGFEPVPAAGTADRGYGQGASAGDYDGDGFPDLYVTNVGGNALYRNNGDGTFSDVTKAAGVGGAEWSVGSAWGDLDGDGSPELYVANYLEYDLRNPLYCGEPHRGIRSYCHISLFEGISDVLYGNDGDGGFTDVTTAAGVENAADGKGLGVVMGHIDNDDRLDIYVANDTAQNFLYLNRGDLVFEDVGLIAGVGFGTEGRAQAGMGTELGDLDGDGAPEIIVANFDVEPVNLFRAVAPGFFLDDTFQLGVGGPTFPTLGFGLAVEDFDGDGDLDLVVANGHILDDVRRTKDNATYAQPNQLLVNRLTELRDGRPAGWRPERDLFTEATVAAGDALSRPRVSRGLAAGDFNGDGRPDLLVGNSNDAGQLLRNDTEAPTRRLVLRLAGRQSTRDAGGTRVFVQPEATDSTWVQEVTSGSSYASQHATDVYVGLGSSAAADVEVVWPNGRREPIGRLQADTLYLLVEGRGVVAQRPLAAR